jgi:hypothetical protein
MGNDFRSKFLGRFAGFHMQKELRMPQAIRFRFEEERAVEHF